ncbi:MAG: GNAT family N-acetyltransferase [Bacteroidia bacterium]|nr:GNAT family N-acetyltransferase [Bacteroidia bacterium]
MEHLHDLIPLFDGYRIFYKQESDFLGARDFLTKRLTNNESIIYLAYIEENPVGFIQLYPIFSSVSMKPMYILNDIFVDSSYRKIGVGKALIEKAQEICKEKSFKGMILETQTSNSLAQQLYEDCGFVKDENLHYYWTNK